MRKIRLYIDVPMATGQQITLPDDAAHHLARVLRARPGQVIELFNGEGDNYQAEITDLRKRAVTVRITDKHPGIRTGTPRIHLGQVLSKGNRMDFAIQKATELGVSGITPLFSERCDVRLGEERQDKRQQHWQQVAISASEQCGRADIPGVHAPMTLADWLAARDEKIRLVLHYADAQPLPATTTPDSVSVLVGPEGGLSAQELAAAHQNGFRTLALGPRILRTETAPLVALSILQWHWGDLDRFRQATPTDVTEAP